MISNTISWLSEQQFYKTKLQLLNRKQKDLMKQKKKRDVNEKNDLIENKKDVNGEKKFEVVHCL
jgi:hypothetical protein